VMELVSVVAFAAAVVGSKSTIESSLQASFDINGFDFSHGRDLALATV